MREKSQETRVRQVESARKSRTDERDGTGAASALDYQSWRCRVRTGGMLGRPVLRKHGGASIVVVTTSGSMSLSFQSAFQTFAHATCSLSVSPLCI
jgi:hypothetical protein